MMAAVASPGSAKRLELRFLSCRGFMLLLGTLIALFYYDVLLGFRTFIIRDYGIFAYPLAYYHRQCFWQGEWPLWNPLTNCGLPFLAQWSTLTLYPPSLIYLLLPLPWSLGLFCLLHLWFAGVGMYMLTRSWTGSGLASAVAGLAFALNGFTLNCLMWPAFLAALAWMPWVFHFVASREGDGRRNFLLAAGAGAAQMLTGAPEVILLTWIPLGLFWLIEVVRPASPAKVPVWRLPALAVVVGLLAAAQLLPFLDFLRNSQRSAAFADATWSMPPWGWANFLVPLFRFYRAPNGVYFQTGQDWTSSYYLGIIVLFLALAGLRRLRDVRLVVLFGLSVFCLLLALGDNCPVYPALRKLIPQLGFMRFPIKFVVLPVFAFPLLAGFGAKELAEAFAQSNRAITRLAFGTAIVLALGICGIVGFGRSHLLPNENWPVLWQNGLSRVALLALALAALWGMRSESRRGWSMAVLLLLVAVDARTHAPSQNPTVARDVYAPGLTSAKMNPAPRLGIARAMLTRATHDKLYGRMLPNAFNDYTGRRLGLLGNTCLLDDIPNVDGFFSLYPGDARKVWEQLFYRSPSMEPNPLADFLGVSQYPHPTEFLEWQPRTNFLPMVTLGQRAVFAQDSEALEAISSADFKPREVVYLPEENRPFVTATSRAVGSISGVNVRPQRVEVSADLDRPGLLVIAQAYYHNWHAYVDGQPVPLWRANYAFQALQLPAGRHQVRVQYEDRAFRVGGIISIVTLLGWALASRKARWTLSSTV